MGKAKSRNIVEITCPCGCGTLIVDNNTGSVELIASGNKKPIDPPDKNHGDQGDSDKNKKEKKESPNIFGSWFTEDNEE